MMGRVIGWAMIAAPFVVLAGIAALDVGWWPVFLTIAALVVLFAWVSVAVDLIWGRWL